MTGSFLEKGFNFNDIDIIIIYNKKLNELHLSKKIESMFGIKTHILLIDNKSLLEGFSSDPIYQLMLSKCVSSKRLIIKSTNRFDFKKLDLHLLKSKNLSDNFELLSGKEKYDLIRNVVAISLFIKNQKVNKESVDREIKIELRLDTKEIIENKIEKKSFSKEYEKYYSKTLNKIMNEIKNGSK
ncbi:hypothetical protein COU57_00145 [Candidatus Pacearchaeota archaeon CG10_big_fil_rev_8_21_14_0_10_32_14]|nr:MAG: hypothetical protein COU57_00145 [Candidatus Pacearchaeota archaeon CG10_big_fil_rev_8_21_14_0_10_32_14]